jgi:hypothetical protein
MDLNEHPASCRSTGRYSVTRAIHAFVFICAAFGTPAFSAADEASMSAVFKQFMATPDEPAILRGDYFKATMAAYQDFAKLLSRKAKQAHSDNTGDSQLASKLSKIENYDISIDQTPSSYIVQLGPTVRDSEDVVFGGGARYEIDRSSFAITKRTYLK